MKSVKNIEQLIKNFNVTANMKMDQRVHHNVLEVMRKSKQKSAGLQPNLWRIIMKNPITKFAAAVIIIVAALAITLLDKAVAPAYAIEQTIQACKNIRFIHFEYFGPSNNKMKDAWLEYDDSGQIKNVRINFCYYSRGDDSVTVWKQGRTQYWDKPSKKLKLFEDKIFTDKIISFAQRYDPARSVENIQKMEKEGKVKIEIDEPSNKTYPIILTAIWEPNTFVIERPWPQMKEVFSIDRSTKLVKAIETYELNDGQYSYIGVWKYPDYNIAFDAQIFSLEDEVPSDVNIVDMMALDIGLEQCDLTNEQIAIKLVREFFKALVAKDYEGAIKLLYHETPEEEAEIQKELEKLDVLRIISIDETFPPPPKSRGVLGVSCILEIEKDGQVVRWEPNDIFVSRVLGHPNRWTIDSFKNP